jgi:hypothetical protein
MPKGKSTYDDLTTLQMALIGYEIEKQKIDEKIREIQARLKGKRVVLPSAMAESQTQPAAKREMSSAARKRISAAQKKRWAEHRRKKKAGAAQGQE